jgi:hypothetical protein
MVLRHTFAIRLLRRGATLNELKEVRIDPTSSRVRHRNARNRWFTLETLTLG